MRRMIASLLLGATLAGCASPAAQTPSPTTQPTAAPTAAPTVAPTAAPTVAPTTAPTIAPTAQSEGKLPALDSGLWRVLGEGAFTDNGVLTRVLYLPSELPADAAFAANYAPEQVAVAQTLLIAQIYEGSELLWLQADRTGVSADVRLWDAPQDAAPAAYVAAFDPGSSFLLSLLPLGADGERLREPIPLNWSAEAVAFRVVPVPPPGQGSTGAPADVPAGLPSAEEYVAIGEAALAGMAAAELPGPTIVGATGVAGDYAAAVAGVFGEAQPRTLVLRRNAGDAWELIANSFDAPAQALTAAGAPQSLATGELRALHEAVIAHLHDPRGQGFTGTLIVEKLDQGFAKLTFRPADLMTLDPVTLFFGPGEGGGWRYLIAGTAFLGPELDQLGVPLSVR